MKESNETLDCMLDHLEDYTDNDIISIVNQMNELHPADPMPPVPIEESIKDFWEFVAKREEEERILSQCLPQNVSNLDDICSFRLYNCFKHFIWETFYHESIPLFDQLRIVNLFYQIASCRRKCSIKMKDPFKM